MQPIKLTTSLTRSTLTRAFIRSIRTKPYSQSTQDYGIVARFLSPTTERETVIIAGIGANGTLAATSMATDERFFGELVRSAGKNAAKKNIEILVTTQIIDNRTGPPKVLDVQYW